MYPPFAPIRTSEASDPRQLLHGAVGSEDLRLDCSSKSLDLAIPELLLRSPTTSADLPEIAAHLVDLALWRRKTGSECSCSSSLPVSTNGSNISLSAKNDHAIDCAN
jgi:hypothetical protein